METLFQCFRILHHTPMEAILANAIFKVICGHTHRTQKNQQNFLTTLPLVRVDFLKFLQLPYFFLLTSRLWLTFADFFSQKCFKMLQLFGNSVSVLQDITSYPNGSNFSKCYFQSYLWPYPQDQQNFLTTLRLDLLVRVDFLKFLWLPDSCLPWGLLLVSLA